MHEHREVRVTARKSVKTPFIAPDMAPVRVIDAELAKGLKGWTDFDVRIPEENKSGVSRGHAERELKSLSVGANVLRKAPSAKREIRTRYNLGGPTPEQRAARAKAGF